MRQVLLSISAGLLLAGVTAAHEGHAPLPTRGAALDPATGVLRLSREARGTLGLETAEVESREISESTFAYATLSAPWLGQALVSSLLPGRIVRLHIRAGDSVKQGQVLADIDSQELQTLRMELLAAQNEAQLSRRLVAQLRPAAKSGAVPAQRLLEAETKLRQEENALTIAKRQWQNLGLPADRLETVLAGEDREPLLLPVRSPLDGTVIHADLSVGKIIDPREHLFEVVDPSTVWVQIDVLEKDLQRVGLGQSVELTLTAFPGKNWSAMIDKLGQSLDPVTHVGRAWATLHNSADGAPQLLPGMSGQVRLQQTMTAKRLTVPLAAVLRDGAERYVLVETAATKEGSEFKKQSVILGRRMGVYAEVRGGALLPGDRLVTKGSHELSSFYVKGSLRLSKETAKDIGLEVSPAGPQIIAEVFEADGMVDAPPDRRSIVASPLSGTIVRILVDRAHAVQAGDVIAEVRSLDLQSLQMELLKARFEAELQTEVLANLQTAADNLPQRRLLEVESALSAARIRQAGLHQRLRTLGLSSAELDRLTEWGELVSGLSLRAPIDGVVVRFDKLLGHVVRADEPLFELHDLSRSYVQAFVSERDVGRIAIGQPARLRFVARPGEVRLGTVVRSGRILGDMSRTLSVWIEAAHAGDAPLPHNALTRISVSGEEFSVPVAVPRSALLQEGSRSYVFVQQPEGIFQRSLVKPGRRDDLFVEILAGLKSGETVAIRGIPQLQTGYAAIR